MPEPLLKGGGFRWRWLSPFTWYEALFGQVKAAEHPPSWYKGTEEQWFARDKAKFAAEDAVLASEIAAAKAASAAAAPADADAKPALAVA